MSSSFHSYVGSVTFVSGAVEFGFSHVSSSRALVKHCSWQHGAHCTKLHHPVPGAHSHGVRPLYVSFGTGDGTDTINEALVKFLPSESPPKTVRYHTTAPNNVNRNAQMRQQNPRWSQYQLQQLHQARSSHASLGPL